MICSAGNEGPYNGLNFAVFGIVVTHGFFKNLICFYCFKLFFLCFLF